MLASASHHLLISQHTDALVCVLSLSCIPATVAHSLVINIDSGTSKVNSEE